jgi:phosphoribosylanthranilate isomerase
MTNEIRFKICGLTSEQAVFDVANAGAHYIGLNFFLKSPRYAAPDLARDLSLATPIGVAKVGLFVDADDTTLDHIIDHVPLDMIQLHGSETPHRVREVKNRYGLPVIKALGISAADDLAKIELFNAVADQILVDAKPPKDAVLPGGNGLSFDWTLIAGRRWPIPWLLAGGLTPENAALAVEMTGARQLDVSSGVESAPGIKNVEKIRAFIAAVNG